MRTNSSAIAHLPRPLSAHGPTTAHGLAWGLVGVIAFSFTVPFTRIAVGGTGGAGLDPLFVGCGRAVVAAALAAVALIAFGAPLPTRRQWLRLAPVSAGVVAGFPILTSLAMQRTSAGHAAVVIGLLPAATAVVAVLLTGERPSSRFWLGAALGVGATVVFSLLAHGGSVGSGPGVADALLAAAVVLGAIGYAQGGLMSRELGSWQTICWALVLAAPVMVTVSAVSVVTHPPHAGAGQWSAFAYLAGVSMFLGFFAWYRGLAIGPMTTVSQIQLVQPVLSVCWAVVMLGEHLTVPLVVGGCAVIACAAFTVRSRVAPTPRQRECPENECPADDECADISTT